MPPVIVSVVVTTSSRIYTAVSMRVSKSVVPSTEHVVAEPPSLVTVCCKEIAGVNIWEQDGFYLLPSPIASTVFCEWDTVFVSKCHRETEALNTLLQIRRKESVFPQFPFQCQT